MPYLITLTTSWVEEEEPVELSDSIREHALSNIGDDLYTVQIREMPDRLPEEGDGDV